MIRSFYWKYSYRILIVICFLLVWELPDSYALFNQKLTPNEQKKIDDFKKDLVTAQRMGYDRLKFYLDSTHQRYQLDNFTQGKILVLIELGYLRFDNAQLPSAYDAFKEAYELSKNRVDLKSIAIAAAGLGTVEGRRRNLEPANIYLFEALDIFQDLENAQGIGATLLKLGMVNLMMHNYNPAIMYFEKALPYTLKSDTGNAITVINNLGAVYLTQDKIDESAKYFTQALELSNNEKYETTQVLALSNLSIIAEKKNDFKQAKQYNEKALQIALKHGLVEQQFILETHKNRLGIHEEKKPQLLIQDIEKLLVKADSLQFYSIVNACLSQLIDLNKKLNNDKETILLLEKKILNNSLIYDREKAIETGNLQSVYELRKSNEDLQNLKEKIALQEKADLYFVLTVLFLLAGLIAALILNSRNKTINKLLKIKEGELLEENRFKDRLFSIIGHDISGVISSQDMGVKLLKNMISNPDGELKKVIEGMQHNLVDLHHILETLLQWGHIKFKGVYLQKTNFAVEPVVQQTLQHLHLKIEDKKLIIENLIHPKQTIYADQNHFRFILRNILSNAIKYSYIGGTITIGVTTNTLKSTHIFYIQDRGVGIHEEIKNEIFKPSHRSKKGTNNEMGNSLALMISKEFMEMNNGHIWFENNKQGGVTFFFEFPFEIAE